jgi:aldehyde dehydrogenase (NAD+)
MMQEHAELFYEALWSDLRRNRTEADWVDVKYMTSEITYVLEHLRHWMEPVPVSTPPSETRRQLGTHL